MSLKLRFKSDKPPITTKKCRFCGGDHDEGTCTALTWCNRCGEKGHFENDCPHHTENALDKKRRRDEEKKNWDKLAEKQAKRGRTDRSWSRGRSVSSSDDEECPIPEVIKPFTEDEKERFENRRKWFADKALRRKVKLQREEEEVRRARQERGEVLTDEEEELTKKKIEEAEEARKAKLAELTKKKRTITKELRDFLISKGFRKKIQVQHKFFRCPDWCTLPEKGLRIDVQRNGARIDTYSIDASLYYMFGFNDMNDFQIRHDSTSRVHMVIVNDGERGKTFICDLKSKHGTFVNGERLRPEEMTELDPGSTITIGTSHTQYVLRRKILWDKEK